MPDIEPRLSPVERLAIAALYASLISKDVLRTRQHPQGEGNKQVERSHILVSHHLSHNMSHQDAS